MGGVPPLTPEYLKSIVDAVEAAGGNKSEAARTLGIPISTLKHQYYQAIKRGFDERIVKAAPAGHRIKGVSTLYDAGGNIASQWVKTASDGPSLEETIEAVRGAFLDMSAAIPSTPPADSNDDLLTLYPLPDLHLALRAWHRDSGGNWDLDIAFNTYRKTMVQVAAGAPPSALSVVLGGGDYIHANTDEYRTRSGNVLDGDGRIDKVVDVAVKLAVFQVDLALRKHQHVVVRFLKGNHDEFVSIAVVYALMAWYRNDPRVTVDTDPDLYWWYRFGKVLLGASHGHNVKITQMPMIMANRRAADWGATLFRYVHMFHVHHKTQHVWEDGGVVSESHQSPVQQDSFHHGRGYLSGRSMQAITYHRERGEAGRSIFAIR